MTEEEFRAELLACAASRAETEALAHREALVAEMLVRLNEAGELPEAEPCSEALVGNRSRNLEIDAFAFDEADSSLHLFIAVRDGGIAPPPAITLTVARDLGFKRLLGIFEQARDGWLTDNIEESRPLWALASRIRSGPRPAALRLHVLTDRPVSERLREIPPDKSSEGIPVEFQLWDVTRLKRIHEAQNVRDDLVIDFTFLDKGGLELLPASVPDDDYQAYLAVIPGEALAAIYRKHGSRLLEGNVRTFLGRRGSTNKGIASTLAKTPSRFFAYNNGISVTASEIKTKNGSGRIPLLTEATDFQIVNGAQTTASLASLQQEGALPSKLVFVPMKLSVVPALVGVDLIPQISRCANSQNKVRESDFFANHAFHRRMEEISRRILAPALGGSQVQTHWYYERARGQYLNDKSSRTVAQRDLFARLNPRDQLVTKMDLGKVEMCFALSPDVACKGAEKAFTAFAERIIEDWKEEYKRSVYGDNWFRGAIARVILFRATERLVSKAPWYEGGYRAQVVAYATARLATLARERSKGGTLDFLKIWNLQVAGPVLEQQLLLIAETMLRVLLDPPQAGRNISEWAKQQACCKRALETKVDLVEGFDDYLLEPDSVRSSKREARDEQRIVDGYEAVSAVMELSADYWIALRQFSRENKLLLSPEDGRAVDVACAVPKRIPSDWQAKRALAVRARCIEAGFPTVSD